MQNILGTILVASECWQQGSLIEIDIVDLNRQGDGVGRWQGRAVFVPDTVPGDRLQVRLVRVKPRYAQGKCLQILQPSEHRIRPSCIVADKCGGCQWQHIASAYQRQIKQQHISEALERIGGFEQPLVAPLLMTDEVLGYRNKATYPLGWSNTGHVQAGYYRRGSHQLVNLNQCPIQDERLNPLLAEVKQDIEECQWLIYDEQLHHGSLRHLALRIGRCTGEMLLTLISTEADLPGLIQQAEVWLARYPELVGVALNINPAKTNVIFGPQTQAIAGPDYVREIFAGLTFQLRPDTFFQVNTAAAEALLEQIIQHLQLDGSEVFLDAYCGVGTFTLPIAQRVKTALGIEVQTAAVEQAQVNAQLNNITNVRFVEGPVATELSKLSLQPDIVLLDPPRKGCIPAVLAALVQHRPQRIVYVSCDPGTLARDLRALCGEGNYRLIRVQPADFFPQTPHIEAAAFLELG